ncbi:MAG: hypothetical protein JWM28_543, partial [Chitinophagaceae bacterium]|nr:hypothetical protein [Chitinophagaceae bacterium]
MSLLAKKWGPVFLLALILFSCKSPDEMGLDVTQSELLNNVFFTDTISVESSTVLMD